MLSSEVSEVRVDRPNKHEDLPPEIAEFDLSHRIGYEWMNSDVTHQFSKYRWSSIVESYTTKISKMFSLSVD